MKLVDIDGVIFVPVVYETHGGVMVEMKMTVGEFFGKFCKGFEPEIIEAIPVEWLKDKMQKPRMTCVYPFGFVLAEWLEEQEAR